VASRVEKGRTHERVKVRLKWKSRRVIRLEDITSIAGMEKVKENVIILL
jgi:hypothetical protein